MIPPDEKETVEVPKLTIQDEPPLDPEDTRKLTVEEIQHYAEMDAATYRQWLERRALEDRDSAEGAG